MFISAIHTFPKFTRVPAIEQVLTSPELSGAGEDSWESPGLVCLKPINPKVNQPWIFIGRTVAEAEAQIFWLPIVKSWLIGKDSDAEKDWRQKEKGATEDEMVGWHHLLNGHESEEIQDRGAWCAAVHGVAKSWMWFSDWTTAANVLRDVEKSLTIDSRTGKCHQTDLTRGGTFPYQRWPLWRFMGTSVTQSLNSCRLILHHSPPWGIITSPKQVGSHWVHHSSFLSISSMNNV